MNIDTLVALRETILDGLLKRERECRDRLGKSTDAEDRARLYTKANTYAHAVELARAEFAAVFEAERLASSFRTKGSP